MRITEVTVGLSRTHSMGNYCNVRPEVRYAVEIAEDDDINVIVTNLMAKARAQIVHVITLAEAEQCTASRSLPSPREGDEDDDETPWEEADREYSATLSKVSDLIIEAVRALAKYEDFGQEIPCPDRDPSKPDAYYEARLRLASALAKYEKELG